MPKLDIESPVLDSLSKPTVVEECTEVQSSKPESESESHLNCSSSQNLAQNASSSQIPINSSSLHVSRATKMMRIISSEVGGSDRDMVFEPTEFGLTRGLTDGVCRISNGMVRWPVHKSVSAKLCSGDTYQTDSTVGVLTEVEGIHQFEESIPHSQLPDTDSPVLHKPWSSGISEDLSEEERKQLELVLGRFPQVFAESRQQAICGALGVTHSIETTGNPIKQKPRIQGWESQMAEQKEVEKMLEEKVIRPSCSPV